MENIKEKIRKVELLKAKGKDLLNELLVLYNVSDSTELPVTVLDVSNYKTEYAEPTPFKGKLYEITDYPVFWVRSEVTGNEYELYWHQVVELGGKAEYYS
jgi:hypothetical protein